MPAPQTETNKSHARRLREGWYERFAPAEFCGLDIGSGQDPLNQTFRRWDKAQGDGDATQLTDIPDAVFRTVYASHVLEHMHNPAIALREWYRVVAPGGHLIICVPDWELYEGRVNLPSRWNEEHKTFWHLDLPEGGPEFPAHHRGLKQLIERVIPEGEVVILRMLDEGHSYPDKSVLHPVGEYSLEAIIRKKD